MPKRDALLAGVLEQPEDDALRLVYADWLDDNGQEERAEFIRAQLRLAALPADSPERSELERREGELLEAHADEWLAPFRAWMHEPSDDLRPHRPRWQFRRGFLERVTLTVETFREACEAGALLGERLLDTAPIREAWFPDCEGGDLADLGAVEALLRLRALDLAGSTYDDGTEELLYSDNLANLKRLDVFCEVHDEGMGGDVWYPLLTSECLAGLEELLLTEHQMDRHTFEYVVKYFALPGLRRLGLEGVVRIGEDVARLLARSKGMRQVEVLAVTRRHLEGKAEAILRKRFGDGLLLNDRDTHEEGWRPCF